MKNGDKRRGLESSQNTQRRGSAKPENDLIRHFLKWVGGTEELLPDRYTIKNRHQMATLVRLIDQTVSERLVSARFIDGIFVWATRFKSREAQSAFHELFLPKIPVLLRLTIKGDDPIRFGRHVLAGYNVSSDFLGPNETIDEKANFAGGTAPNPFDTSQAGEPGRLAVNRVMLELLHPDLFNDGPLSDDLTKLHGKKATSSSLIEMLEQHMLYGDAQPALVLSLEPLLIAAYSYEMDCVAFLLYPDLIADKLKRLYKVGFDERVVTVNTYFVDAPRQGDIFPGPDSIGRYQAFWPVIAETVCRDQTAIRALHERIPEASWGKLEEAVSRYYELPERLVRMGLPLHSCYKGMPISVVRTLQNGS